MSLPVNFTNILDLFNIRNFYGSNRASYSMAENAHFLTSTIESIYGTGVADGSITAVEMQ